MPDLFYVGLALAFGAGSLALVRFLDRLGR